MTPEQLERCRLLASSSVVGADIKALLDELKDRAWWEKTAIELQSQRDALAAELVDDLRKAIWYLNRELEKLLNVDLSKMVDRQVRLKILPPPETPFSSTLPLTLGDIGDVFDLQNGLIAVRFAAGDIWLNPIWVEFL